MKEYTFVFDVVALGSVSSFFLLSAVKCLYLSGEGTTGGTSVSMPSLIVAL